MHTGGIGHGLIDDLADTVGGHFGLQLQWFANRLGNRPRRALWLKRHLAASEARRVDAPEHDVGVGYRRMNPAPPIGGRPGIRGGAFRADTNSLQGVDVRDGTATGADFQHFNNRHPQGQPAALDEAGRAIHLKFPRGLRSLILNQTDLGRRPAHVEGNHFVEREFRGHSAGQDGSTRGSRFHQADWEPHGRFEGR